MLAMDKTNAMATEEAATLHSTSNSENPHLTDENKLTYKPLLQFLSLVQSPSGGHPTPLSLEGLPPMRHSPELSCKLVQVPPIKLIVKFCCLVVVSFPGSILISLNLPQSSTQILDQRLRS